eukprot:scaffold4026_cov117-Cylindrotheca_fusiformis.AAC.24
MLKQTKEGKVFFPERLFGMLESAPAKRFDHIISWTEEGDAFVVRDVVQFEKQVLSWHFKHKSIRSFTRQLSYWSIQRVSKGPNTLTFQHPFLRRGERSLIASIERKEHKGNRVKRNGVTINLRQCEDKDSVARLIELLQKNKRSISKTAKKLCSTRARSAGNNESLLKELNFALQNGDIASTFHRETLQRIVGDLHPANVQGDGTPKPPKRKRANIALDSQSLKKGECNLMSPAAYDCEATSRSVTTPEAPAVEENQHPSNGLFQTHEAPLEPYVEKAPTDLELSSLENFGNDDYITSDFAQSPFISRFMEPRPFCENAAPGEGQPGHSIGSWCKSMEGNKNVTAVLLPDDFPLFAYDHPLNLPHGSDHRNVAQV